MSHPPIPPATATQVAREAARASWAVTDDRPARTQPARAAFDQRFLDAADGDPERAAELRSEYYRWLRSLRRTRRSNAEPTPSSRVEDRIRELLLAAPPLSKEQRARLSTLVRTAPGESAAGDAA